MSNEAEGIEYGFFLPFWPTYAIMNYKVAIVELSERL